MAGNVKKGFGIYLLILLLCVVAAFLITCVVMIFQPFKVVMGYKYFTYKEMTPFEYQLTSGDNIDINIAEKDIIRMSSNYANIRIEKNTRVDDVAVGIKVYAKGFAKANQDTDFNYSITTCLEDGKKVLDVSIKEPQGSLFFQKDVEIILYVPYYDASNGAHDLSNKEIIVLTKSGTVFVGNQRALTENSTSQNHSKPKINPENLTIQSDNGKVYLYSAIDSSSIKKLNIITQGSYVTMFDDLTISNKLRLKTEYGSFIAKNINCSGDSEIILQDGKLKMNNFTGKMNFSIKNGEIIVNNINGSIISNNSTEVASHAQIEIQSVSENVSLPFLGNSYVKINKIDGQAYLQGDGSNINIKEISGKSWFKTTSGNIYVYAMGNDIVAETDSGKIEAYFAGEEIQNLLSFSSKSGEIKLNILPSLAYKMNVYDLSGQPRVNNIKVEPFDSYDNPLIVNGGDKEIKFVSNGAIRVSLFSLSNV